MNLAPLRRDWWIVDFRSYSFNTGNTGSTDTGCYYESETLFPWLLCFCQVHKLRVLAPRPSFRCIKFLVFENMSYAASQGNSVDECFFKEAYRDWNHWNLLSRESLCTWCRGKVCKNFERTSGAPTLTKMFVATCQFSRVVIGVLGCRRMDNRCFGLLWGMRDLSGHIVPTSEQHRS